MKHFRDEEYDSMKDYEFNIMSHMRDEDEEDDYGSLIFKHWQEDEDEPVSTNVNVNLYDLYHFINNDSFNELETNLIKKLKNKKIKYYQNVEKIPISNNIITILNTKEYDNIRD